MFRGGYFFETTINHYRQPNYLGDNGLDWADKDMLSSYNGEMNSIISAFKDWQPNTNPDAYYLFVVPKFSEGGVEGFMPRNRRFGFVTLSQLDARLVAHEIGHGAFNLRHTFPEVPQGSTDNLMDYPPAGGQAADSQTSLLKPQWDLIHNPETTTGLFDEMEEGASQLNELSGSNFFIRNGVKNSTYKPFYNDYFDGFSKSATFNKIVNLFTASNSRVKTLVVKQGTQSQSEASTGFGFITVRKNGKSTYTDFEHIGKLTVENLSNAELAFRIGYKRDANELKFAHEFFVHVIKDIEDINKIYAESKNNADILNKLKALPDKSQFVSGDGGDRDHYRMLKGECYLMTEYVREILAKETNYPKRYKILEDYIEDLAMYLEPEHDNLLKSFGGKEIAKKAIKNYLLDSFSEYKEMIKELTIKHLK